MKLKLAKAKIMIANMMIKDEESVIVLIIKIMKYEVSLNNLIQ